MEPDYLIALRRIGILCAAVLIAACASGGGNARRGPSSAATQENAFRETVRVLTTAELAGRRPGTPGADATVAYLVDRFRTLGLKPGNGDSFLQSVPLTEITASGPTLQVTGRGEITPWVIGKDAVLWTQRQENDVTVHASDLIFMGYGIDYAGVDVRGKTVVVLVGSPGLPSHAMTAHATTAYKIAEAERHGVAAVLLIHNAAVAGSWNGLLDERAGPQVQLSSADRGAGHAALDGWLSAEAAAALFRQAGMDLATATRAAAEPGFKPLALGLQVDGAIHTTIRRFSSSNVVALLPGTDRKREYVVYTAHWDHLGRQPQSLGGALLPGAVDDAAGVAGLLMLAQSFGRIKPPADRTLVFIVFTGEAGGLLGSSFYVSQPLLPLRDTVAVLDLSDPYVGGPTRDIMVMGYGNSELDEDVRDLALLQGRAVGPDPHPERGLAYRANQFTFSKAGVPALSLRAGLDDSARGPSWGQRQLDDYFFNRWNQPGDLYTADWDLRGTFEDMELYQEVGNRLAHSRRFPRFYPNSEFRLNLDP